MFLYKKEYVKYFNIVKNVENGKYVMYVKDHNRSVPTKGRHTSICHIKLQYVNFCRNINSIDLKFLYITHGIDFPTLDAAVAIDREDYTSK